MPLQQCVHLHTNSLSEVVRQDTITVNMQTTVTGTITITPGWFVGIQQEVGKLQISVCNVMLVAVAECVDDLSEEVACNGLVELVLFAVAVQIASSFVCHYNA